MKNYTYIKNTEVITEPVSGGVTRKVLAYNDEIMCVEHYFKAGAIGKLHSHPHTQITYAVKGRFRFTVNDEPYLLEAGDSLLKTNNVIHGCECLEEGVLLDIFTPMRKDFIE